MSFETVKVIELNQYRQEREAILVEVRLLKKYLQDLDGGLICFVTVTMLH